MNLFLQDLFEFPARLYDNVDNSLVELFRPLTRRLDKKTPFAKYVFDLTFDNFNLLSTFFEFYLEVISSLTLIHFVQKPFEVFRMIFGDHKSYSEDGNGRKKNYKSLFILYKSVCKKY